MSGPGWWQRLAARDPRGIALRRALRAASIVPLALALFMRNSFTAPAAMFGVFAVLSLLVFADFGGRMRDRFWAYVITSLVGAGLLFAGSFAGVWVWSAALFMAVVTLLVGLLGVLRGLMASAQNVLLLVTVLSVTSSHPSLALRASCVWLLGGAVATAAAMLLWPAKSAARLRKVLADAYELAADAFEKRWVLAADDEQWMRARQRFNDTVADLHGLYDGNLQRPSGLTHADRCLAQLVDEVGRLRVFLNWRDLAAPDEPGRGVSLRESTAALAEQSVSVLRDSAQMIRDGKGDIDLSDLLAARDANLVVASQWLQKRRSAGLRGGEREQLDDVFPVRAGSVSTLLVARDTRELWNRPWASIGLAGRMRRTIPSPMLRLWMHVRWRSPWFRVAVRSAVALAIGVTLAKTSGLDHGFWIVLGALNALRFDALGTGRTALQAFGGTAVGVVLAAAMVLLVGQNVAVYWAILPVALFLVAFTPGTFSLAFGQAGFSLTTLTLFSIIDAASLQTAEVRLLDVSIGISVSLVVSLLMWPRGVVQTLYRLITDAIDASSDYLVAAADYLCHGAIDQRLLDHFRDASFAANERAREAFDLAVAQRPPQTVPLQDWARVANVSTFTQFAAQIAPIAQDTTREHGADRAVPAIVVGPYLDAANATRDSLRAAVRQWADTARTVATNPDASLMQAPMDFPFEPSAAVVALRTALDNYLTGDSDWEGAGDDPRPATLVWVSDWTALLDWAAARIARGAEVAAAGGSAR